LNGYLGHAHALLNWMERHGRTTFNPLKPVNKLARKDTFKRRALSADELMRLVTAQEARLRLSGRRAHGTEARRNQAADLAGRPPGCAAAVHRRARRNDEEQEGRCDPDHS
jgi:hypothetical protein